MARNAILNDLSYRSAAYLFCLALYVPKVYQVPTASVTGVSGAGALCSSLELPGTPQDPPPTA